MNARLLKAKRVEAGLRQTDLAKSLGITDKTMNHKERSTTNKFSADEMLTLSRVLHLTLAEFNSIFYGCNLPIGYTDGLKQIEEVKSYRTGEELFRQACLRHQ